MSPARTSRSMPSTARSRPNRLTSPRVVITAVTTTRLGSWRGRRGEGVQGDRAGQHVGTRARAAPPASARPDRRPAGCPASSRTASGAAPGRCAARRPDRGGTGATASRVTPRPYRPMAGGTPSSCGAAGRPARRAAGTGSIRRPASSTISASRASRTRAPSGGVKAVTAADGRPTSRSRNRVSSAGRSIPFSYTCTCSGRPLSGVHPDVDPADGRRLLVRDQAQAQGVVAGHPAGADPAQLVVGGLGQQAPAQRRRAAGPAARAARAAWTRRGWRWPRSYSQVQVPHSSWWVLVSPAAVITSTRWSSARATRRASRCGR